MRAAKNPASLHTRQPGINQKRLALSVSAALDRACVRTVGIGTTHLRAGCRGFIGPVPLPLVIRGITFASDMLPQFCPSVKGFCIFSVFFSGKYKKSTRPLISSSKPVVCGSVSEIYLSLRVSRSSPKIRSSISGRSGCWGIISFLILLSPPSLYSMLYYSTIFPDCKLNFCKLTTIKQKTDARSCIRSIYKA